MDQEWTWTGYGSGPELDNLAIPAKVIKVQSCI